MTSEQRRIHDVQKFTKQLDKQKTYFTDFEKEVVPIVEVSELDEESTVSKAHQDRAATVTSSKSEAPVYKTKAKASAQKPKAKKAKETEKSSDEESGTSEEDDEEEKEES